MESGGQRVPHIDDVIGGVPPGETRVFLYRRFDEELLKQDATLSEYPIIMKITVENLDPAVTVALISDPERESDAFPKNRRCEIARIYRIETPAPSRPPDTGQVAES